MQNITVRGISALVLRVLLLGILGLTSIHAGSAPTHAASPLSCSAPVDATERAQCAAVEGQILDSTIYLLFRRSCGAHGTDSGQSLVASHATIVDERAVLTHNHYGWLGDPECALTALYVFRGRGEQLAKIEDPAQLDNLARQLRPDPDGNRDQARTLTFPEPLFTPSPLVVERFAGLPDDGVLAGWGELAEINWHIYPRQTYVQWVKPSRVEVEGQALGLVVQKAVQVGASGGGVFRIVDGQLHHIGNVWATQQHNDTSIVALNVSASIQ